MYKMYFYGMFCSHSTLDNMDMLLEYRIFRGVKLTKLKKTKKKLLKDLYSIIKTVLLSSQVDWNAKTHLQNLNVGPSGFSYTMYVMCIIKCIFSIFSKYDKKQSNVGRIAREREGEKEKRRVHFTKTVEWICASHMYVHYALCTKSALRFCTL